MTAQADFHAAIAKLELQSQATKDLLTSKLDAYLTAIALGIEGVTADASELNLTTDLKAGTLTPKLFKYEASILEVNAGGVGRSATELLRKVKAAQYVAAHPGEVCPAKWKEGEKTLKPSLDLVGKI